MIALNESAVGSTGVVAFDDLLDPFAPVPVEAYYDTSTKCYWVANSRGQWIQVTDAGLRLRLREAGFDAKQHEGERISQVAREVLRIQNEHDVAYAGPLAGYPVGEVEALGERILVTKAAKLVQAEPGEWNTIRRLLMNLFGDESVDQLP